MKINIKIGSRGSKLALIQANIVKNLIESTIPETAAEIIIIKTKGDKILDTPLSSIGDKGLFTKEIEDALLRKEIDIAVHSLKDLPTQLPSGLDLGAVLKRGEVRDVLISRDNIGLNELNDTHVLGTSSLRRRSQIFHLHKGIQVKDIRGNIDTRLKKLENGEYDALILAGSGLERAGFQSVIAEYLEPAIMIPAVCQGIIGIESRQQDPDISIILQKINHPETMQMALTERAFLKRLEGGCQIPIGCYSKVDSNQYYLNGFISDLCGTQIIYRDLKIENFNSEQIGIQLADDLLNSGGKTILDKIKKENNQ